MPSQLCLLPPCSASSKNCQSYPQLLQPIQSSEKLMNQNFQYLFTSLSSLDMSWPSMLFTSSIFPRNFSASSSSLMYVENITFSQLAQKSLTSSPSEDGCFPQASALFDLDPSLERFWHFLTLPPSSGTHSQLFDQCLILQ